MSQIDLKPNKSKGGRRPVIKSRGEIEQAISVTQSMRQAAIYLNLSYMYFVGRPNDIISGILVNRRMVVK